MDSFFLSIPISGDKNICIAPMTIEMAQEAGAKSSMARSGYFVYEYVANSANPEISILGRLQSEEAAVALGRVLADGAAAMGINRDIEIVPSEMVPWV